MVRGGDVPGDVPGAAQCRGRRAESGRRRRAGNRRQTRRRRARSSHRRHRGRAARGGARAAPRPSPRLGPRRGRRHGALGRHGVQSRQALAATVRLGGWRFGGRVGLARKKRQRRFFRGSIRRALRDDARGAQKRAGARLRALVVRRGQSLGLARCDALAQRRLPGGGVRARARRSRRERRDQGELWRADAARFASRVGEKKTRVRERRAGPERRRRVRRRRSRFRRIEKKPKDVRRRQVRPVRRRAFVRDAERE
mmetsp:Transcript_4547/g.19386  ORF Transcript_4547/g.19386 Transcript_4547/m.19386 type:complete len:255 (-) Transcript_4547:1047-1811(-)